MELALVLSGLFACAIVVMAYPGYAIQRGWPVAHWAFSEGTPGTWVSLSALLVVIAAPLTGLIKGPWWLLFLIPIGGYISGLLATKLFRRFVQPIGIIGSVLGWAVLPFILFNDGFGDSRKAASWTQEEKLNAVYFIRAERAAQEAVKISNRGPAFSILSENEVSEILRLMNIALAEARLVKDPVLEKAYPGMSKPFRELFMRGVELQIRTLSNADASASVESTRRLNDWADWMNAHNDEIKIPKP